MKIFALACLLLALSACKKFEGIDVTVPQRAKPVWVPLTDSIPDNASFTLKLFADSTDYDEAAFIFNQRASVAFSNANDAPYFPGFGKVSLASISSDNKEMAFYKLPYKSGMSIGLDVHGKKDGQLTLKIAREQNVPPGIRILVKDGYTRDSVDLTRGTYNFSVVKADTNSFGARRLKLVLKSE